MNEDKHKIIQELLKEIFNNINTWLAHAEAKNAAIIAFNITCLSFIWNMKDIDKIRTFFYIICIGMLLSTIIALISFFPQLDKKNKSKNPYPENDNLIFYKDIAKYCQEEYIKAIFKQYVQIDIPDTEIQKIERDFSEEITYNSTVIIRKYKWFNYSLIIEIIMLIFFAIAIIHINI